MIRVVVVDDQQVMREGLVALLGLIDGVEVAGSAGDGRQALDLLRHTAADVVLMDLRMPVLDGVAATRLLKRDHPEVAVVVLTTYADDASIADAVRAGARGYLTKDAGRAEIGAAVRSAANGQAIFAAEVSDRLVAALESRTTRAKTELPDGLTAREAEVLGLIARGLSNPEIAAELFIGEATVKSHINHAFAKIGVRNRAEAVRYGLEKGL
ncbi:response regulator [Amycolatopsis roodepoortensis]|uniref:DNA-binding NarL/FixJ family response regulator n=1 Tax=Amycolatopsis roodepoortensis TaxID=700274 RepID=A0ABR9LKQ2_9PSEU|nr:response regulator transcription factor [Amycolatopsis roodepoortensis]MBE1581254.1 DNA-binding NarL/FixJ family response regulator [Amycolatopsis roodepoortensis]